MNDYTLLQQDTEVSALDALTISLRDFRGWQASTALYDFLDNCILRLVRKTIKYFSDAVDLEKDVKATPANGHSRPVSLLLMAILEQWPYFIEACHTLDLENVVTWLAQILTVLKSIGEDGKMLDLICERLGAQIKNRENLTVTTIASDILSDPEWESTLSNSLKPEEIALNNDAILKESSKGQPSTPLQTLPPGPPKEAEDHPGLSRWTNKEVAEAIDDGSLADLLFCLSSQHKEIRMQSLSGIQILMAKLKVSILL